MSSRGPIPSPDDEGFFAWMRSPAAGEAVAMLNKLARLEIAFGGKRFHAVYSGENALIDLKDTILSGLNGLPIMPSNTVLANNAVGAARPTALTATQTRILLGLATTDRPQFAGITAIRGVDQNFSVIRARPEAAQNGANVISEFYENNDINNSGYAFYGLSNGNTWATSIRCTFLASSKNGTGTTPPIGIWAQDTRTNSNMAVWIPPNTTRVLLGGITTDDGTNTLQVNGSITGTALTLTGSITTAAPSGGTAAPWKLGTVASVSPTAQNRTIELEVNGTRYFLSAKTTND